MVAEEPELSPAGWQVLCSLLWVVFKRSECVSRLMVMFVHKSVVSGILMQLFSVFVSNRGRWML